MCRFLLGLSKTGQSQKFGEREWEVLTCNKKALRNLYFKFLPGSSGTRVSVPFLGVYGTHFSHGVLGPASETGREKEYLHASAIFSNPELLHFEIVCPESHQQAPPTETLFPQV